MRAFIWDLDGTLLDSYGVITSGAVDTLKDFGIAADPDMLLRRMKNDSLTRFLRETGEANGVAFEKLIGRYREITHERDSLITLADGAAETLRRIRENGGANYVYTHRGDSTFRILERLGILGEFEDLITGGDGFAPKPSGEGVRELIRRHGLNPQAACYVGDRPMDVLCARDAGVTAMLYLPEGGCVEPTGEEDLIVPDLRQLAELDEIIVRATGENAEEVLSLYRVQLGRECCNWNENYPGRETIEYDLARDSLFVMKDRDGKIIGAISVDQDEDVDQLPCWSPDLQPGGEFSRVAVAPACQNRGLAKKLVLYVAEVLKRRGYRSIHILVYRGNFKALRTYAFFGFRLVGECHLFGEDFLCYEKELN